MDDVGVEAAEERGEGRGGGVLVEWEGEEVRREGRVVFDLRISTLV